MKKKTSDQKVLQHPLALIVAIRVLGRGVFEEAALQTIADEAKPLSGWML